MMKNVLAVVENWQNEEKIIENNQMTLKNYQNDRCMIKNCLKMAQAC